MAKRGFALLIHFAFLFVFLHFYLQYTNKISLHQRKKQIKKKFGESVKYKNRVVQENELLCKIIAYNITVLIHKMIQLGASTNFLSFNGLQKEKNLKHSNEYGMEEKRI